MTVMLLTLLRLSTALQRKLLMATIQQIHASATAQAASLDALLPVVTTLAQNQLDQSKLDALAQTIDENSARIAAITQAASTTP